MKLKKQAKDVLRDDYRKKFGTYASDRDLKDVYCQKWSLCEWFNGGSLGTIGTRLFCSAMIVLAIAALAGIWGGIVGGCEFMNTSLYGRVVMGLLATGGSLMLVSGMVGFVVLIKEA